MRRFLDRDKNRLKYRFKAGVCHRIVDIRYRESVGIQCLVEWYIKKRTGPTRIWDSFKALKKKTVFLTCLQRFCESNPITVEDLPPLDMPPLSTDECRQMINGRADAFDPLEYYCFARLYHRALRTGYVGPNFLRVFSEQHKTHLFIERRAEQEVALAALEDLYSRQTGVTVSLENEIDLEVPGAFKFVAECFSNSVVIPDDPLVGCSCRKCNQNTSCCSEAAGNAPFAYTRKGLLRLEPGKAIYECNRRCVCDAACLNRVVQHGCKIDLCVFKTQDRGWGLKALHPLKRGQFITEYTGEIIDSLEAEKRGHDYDNIGLTYLFDLDYNNPERPFTIDAYAYGNLSRFINHACYPNCAIWVVFVDCLEPNLPRLGIFAVRDIEQGEELTFDYNCGQGLVVTDTTKRIGQCLCNSKRCRKYLFV